jgi:hypothetical protein
VPGLVHHLEGRGLPVRKNHEKSRGHASMKSRFLLTRAGDSCFYALIAMVPVNKNNKKLMPGCPIFVF